MKSAQYKRRQYFLKDSVQPKLILKTYLILCMVMLISGAVFYFIGNKNLTTEYFQAHSMIKTTMELLLPALILVNLVGLIAAAFLVIMHTHAIAGPIYKLRQLSEKISQGDLTVEVKFRRKDLIQELSEAINTIIQGLNRQIRGLEDPARELRELAFKIQDLNRLPEPELLALKERLLSAIVRLEEKLKQFRL